MPFGFVRFPDRLPLSSIGEEELWRLHCLSASFAFPTGELGEAYATQRSFGLHCLSASFAFPTVKIRQLPNGNFGGVSIAFRLRSLSRQYQNESCLELSSLVSPLPFGFVRFPDMQGSFQRQILHFLSPLPFGFVRFPDVGDLSKLLSEFASLHCLSASFAFPTSPIKAGRVASPGVSIAFRLRSLSRRISPSCIYVEPYRRLHCLSASFAFPTRGPIRRSIPHRRVSIAFRLRSLSRPDADGLSVGSGYPSPLPFGFVRFPDLKRNFLLSTVLVQVSIAFRLRSLSRHQIDREYGRS